MALSRRGQATTEAALGILVISTVIVFGIHFSEVAMLSLKVQEAATSALWDVTGQKMHTLATDTPDFAPRQAAIDRAGPDGTGKYADYDGRASRPGATPVLTFTQASPIAVTCVADNSLPPMDLGISPINLLFAAGQGGMACHAEADFGLVPRFSRSFLDGTIFREQHVQWDTYHLCSMARANGNACGARLLVVLGDWGLADNAEANNCDRTQARTACENPGYYLMAQRAFDTYAGGMAEGGAALARAAFGDPTGGPNLQVDETAFFMASVGDDWTQPQGYQMIDPGQEHFPTAPFSPYTVTPGGPYGNAVLQTYPQAAQQREPCAFGLPCDPSQWPSYQ